MIVSLTLPLRLSKILAGEPGSADGREVDDARREARGLALDKARKVAKREGIPVEAITVDIHACKSHGGSLLDVIEGR
jgi:hypothetical protein